MCDHQSTRRVFRDSQVRTKKNVSLTAGSRRLVHLSTLTMNHGTADRYLYLEKLESRSGPEKVRHLLNSNSERLTIRPCPCRCRGASSCYRDSLVSHVRIESC